MTNPRNYLRRAHDGLAGLFHWVQSPLVILVSLCLSFSSLAYTSIKTSVQSEHLRTTFCGVFEPIALQPPNPGAPRSPLGTTIVDASKNAISPEGLDCTPDPRDGR